MKRILILFLCLLPLFSIAETDEARRIFEGKIVEVLSNKNQAPLPGASVFWKNTTKGTATDVDGRFTLDKSNKSDILVVQFVGYETREIDINKFSGKELIIELSPNLQLNEVVVSKRRAGTVLDRQSPIQSQRITGNELCKAACCNLAESFETNASVDVSYADAATGAKSIKLLGLTGKYIEMMTEKNPNFKGLASVYGMAYVPGPWMESIQVSKGVGSVVNGFESITGQINIEYQKPQNAPILYLNGFTNSMGMSEGNLMTGVKISDNLSTSILAHGQDNKKEIDQNKDNFLDDPMVRQYNFINRWHWKPNKDWITQFGVKFIDEQRIGGQKDYDESHTNDINNAYRINIDTRRYEAFAKIGYVFPKNDERSIALITNFSSHEQKSFYGLRNYDAKQKYLYANLLFQSYIGNLKHKYTAGLSFIYDDFYDNLYKTVNNQSITNPFKPKGTKRAEKIAGAYVEYTWLPSDEITLQTGLRYDHNSVYGGFITPRVHFRYQFAEGSTLRLAAGSGRRTSNPIAENSFLLASNRTFNIQSDLEQEKAWNYGLSVTQYFNLFGQDFTASADFYRTEFQNQIIVDVDKNINQVNFYNLDGQSFANNYQVELKFEPLDRLDVTTAIRFSDVKADINDEFQKVPYVNRYKGLVNLSYSTNMNIWQFDFTTQVNGDMRIPSTAGNPVEYQRREQSPAYAVMNAQVTKRFKIWEAYFGVENLGNYTQKKPIIAAGDPHGSNFDASMIWGPIQERKFFLGVRLTIDRD